MNKFTIGDRVVFSEEGKLITSTPDRRGVVEYVMGNGCCRIRWDGSTTKHPSEPYHPKFLEKDKSEVPSH